MRGRIRRYVPAVAAALALPLTAASPAHAGDPVVCSISVDDVTMAEGDDGTTTFTFTITESGTVLSPSTVNYATADGTATATDYTAKTGSVSLGPATPSATVDVLVTGDTAFEPDETFFLDISSSDTTCVIAKNRGTGTIQNDDTPAPAPPTTPSGYRLTALDGGVFNYGASEYEGSASQIPDLQAPVIDIDETPDRSGYWQVALDGGVFSWNAPFHGSAGGLPLNAPIFGIAARPQGDGYWLVGLDGGVFAFGNAPFKGSKASTSAQEGLVIVDIVSTSTGEGYWLLDAYGQVFAFGDALHVGNHAAADVEAVGLAPTPDNAGYWIVNWAGQVFAFGTAIHQGDIDEPERLNGSIVAIEATETGDGYWLAGWDGGVFAFGDADFQGSAGGLPLQGPVVAISGKR